LDYLQSDMGKVCFYAGDYTVIKRVRHSRLHPVVKPVIIELMGYPEWTLLGMGLSIMGALVALAFALLGQSPGLTQRLGLSGARLDLRVRSFTTYAFALLLLTIGFFLAGIPVDSQSSDPVDTAAALESSTTTPMSTSEGAEDSSDSGIPTPLTSPTEASSPESGSFSGPPPSIPTNGPDAEGTNSTAQVDGSELTDETSAPPRETTGSPQASSTPTAIASPTPTETPSPTITPTPITGETAIVSSGGSTVWITRSPGGQNLTLVRDGDIVLILSGHANQAGLLWREVRAVNGILGWIQENYLEYEE
jgi:hypothetical protein